MAKKGIDVSQNNGVVNWQSVKSSGYEDFAIIRCGYGNDSTSQDDKQFINNINKCEELGIPYGIYLYSYALNLTDAGSEAKHVLRLLKNVGNNFKYGVWFDMEDADNYKSKHGMPSNQKLVDICYTFCSKMEEAGYYTGIYASKSWLDNQLNNPKLDRFDKWVAQWNNTGCTYSKPYSLWQNSSNLLICGKRFDSNILVNDFAGGTKPVKPISKPTSTGDITYQAYDNAKKQWLPEVVNNHDYAGNFGNSAGGVRAKCKNGNIYISAHILNGKWLSTINSSTYSKNSNNGNTYSGLINKPVDGLKIWSDYGFVKYRVHLKNGKWLPWVTKADNTKEGYAGILGKEIDAVQML